MKPTDLDVILAEAYNIQKLNDLHFKTDVSEEMKRAFKNIPIEYIENHFKGVGVGWAIPTNLWFFRSYKKNVLDNLQNDIEIINTKIMLMTMLRQTPRVLWNWLKLYYGHPPFQLDDPTKQLQILPIPELPCGLFTLSFRKSSILLYLKLNREMSKMYRGKIVEYSIRKIQELANKYHMRQLSKEDAEDKLSSNEMSDLIKMLKETGKFDEMSEEELKNILDQFTPEQLRNLTED